MGINIGLYRILSITKEETYGAPSDFCETENIDWFDHCRYSGDREFMGFEKWKGIDSDGEYVRPIDINERRDWVKNNVHEGNKERLLKALDLMEQDEMVGIHASY